MYKIGQASVLLYACMISFFQLIFIPARPLSLVSSHFLLSFYSPLLCSVIFFSSSSPCLCSHLQSDSDSSHRLIDLSAYPTISISTFTFTFFL